MKIVHEVGRNPQCAGTGRFYGSMVVNPPRWLGVNADVMAGWVGPGEEHNAVYFEGDLDDMRELFKGFLSVLDTIETTERERFTKMMSRIVQCPKCMTYTTSVEHPDEGHGNGMGVLCHLPEDMRYPKFEKKFFQGWFDDGNIHYTFCAKDVAHCVQLLKDSGVEFFDDIDGSTVVPVEAKKVEWRPIGLERANEIRCHTEDERKTIKLADAHLGEWFCSEW